MAARVYIDANTRVSLEDLKVYVNPSHRRVFT